MSNTETTTKKLDYGGFGGITFGAIKMLLIKEHSREMVAKTIIQTIEMTDHEEVPEAIELVNQLKLKYAL